MNITDLNITDFVDFTKLLREGPIFPPRGAANNHIDARLFDKRDHLHSIFHHFLALSSQPPPESETSEGTTTTSTTDTTNHTNAVSEPTPSEVPTTTTTELQTTAPIITIITPSESTSSTTSSASPAAASTPATSPSPTVFKATHPYKGLSHHLHNLTWSNDWVVLLFFLHQTLAHHQYSIFGPEFEGHALIHMYFIELNFNIELRYDYSRMASLYIELIKHIPTIYAYFRSTQSRHNAAEIAKKKEKEEKEVEANPLDIALTEPNRAFPKKSVGVVPRAPIYNDAQLVLSALLQRHPSLSPLNKYPIHGLQKTRLTPDIDTHNAMLTFCKETPPSISSTNKEPFLELFSKLSNNIRHLYITSLLEDIYLLSWIGLLASVPVEVIDDASKLIITNLFQQMDLSTAFTIAFSPSIINLFPRRILDIPLQLLEGVMRHTNYFPKLYTILNIPQIISQSFSTLITAPLNPRCPDLSFITGNSYQSLVTLFRLSAAALVVYPVYPSLRLNFDQLVATFITLYKLIIYGIWVDFNPKTQSISPATTPQRLLSATNIFPPEAAHDPDATFHLTNLPLPLDAFKHTTQEIASSWLGQTIRALSSSINVISYRYQGSITSDFLVPILVPVIRTLCYEPYGLITLQILARGGFGVTWFLYLWSICHQSPKLSHYATLSPLYHHLSTIIHNTKQFQQYLHSQLFYRSTFVNDVDFPVAPSLFSPQALNTLMSTVSIQYNSILFNYHLLGSRYHSFSTLNLTPQQIDLFSVQLLKIMPKTKKDPLPTLTTVQQARDYFTDRTQSLPLVDTTMALSRSMNTMHGFQQFHLQADETFLGMPHFERFRTFIFDLLILILDLVYPIPMHFDQSFLLTESKYVRKIGQQGLDLVKNDDTIGLFTLLNGSEPTGIPIEYHRQDEESDTEAELDNVERLKGDDIDIEYYSTPHSTEHIESQKKLKYQYLKQHYINSMNGKAPPSPPTLIYERQPDSAPTVKLISGPQHSNQSGLFHRINIQTDQVSRISVEQAKSSIYFDRHDTTHRIVIQDSLLTVQHLATVGIARTLGTIAAIYPWEKPCVQMTQEQEIIQEPHPDSHKVLPVEHSLVRVFYHYINALHTILFKPVSLLIPPAIDDELMSNNYTPTSGWMHDPISAQYHYLTENFTKSAVQNDANKNNDNGEHQKDNQSQDDHTDSYDGNIISMSRIEDLAKLFPRGGSRECECILFFKFPFYQKQVYHPQMIDYTDDIISWYQPTKQNSTKSDEFYAQLTSKMQLPYPIQLSRCLYVLYLEAIIALIHGFSQACFSTASRRHENHRTVMTSYLYIHHTAASSQTRDVLEKQIIEQRKNGQMDNQINHQQLNNSSFYHQFMAIMAKRSRRTKMGKVHDDEEYDEYHEHYLDLCLASTGNYPSYLKKVCLSYQPPQSTFSEKITETSSSPSPLLSSPSFSGPAPIPLCKEFSSMFIQHGIELFIDLLLQPQCDAILKTIDLTYNKTTYDISRGTSFLSKTPNTPEPMFGENSTSHYNQKVDISSSFIVTNPDLANLYSLSNWNPNTAKIPENKIRNVLYKNELFNPNQDTSEFRPKHPHLPFYYQLSEKEKIALGDLFTSGGYYSSLLNSPTAPFACPNDDLQREVAADINSGPKPGHLQLEKDPDFNCFKTKYLVHDEIKSESSTTDPDLVKLIYKNHLKNGTTKTTSPTTSSSTTELTTTSSSTTELTTTSSITAELTTTSPITQDDSIIPTQTQNLDCSNSLDGLFKFPLFKTNAHPYSQILAISTPPADLCQLSTKFPCLDYKKLSKTIMGDVQAYRPPPALGDDTTVCTNPLPPDGSTIPLARNRNVTKASGVYDIIRDAQDQSWMKWPQKGTSVYTLNHDPSLYSTNEHRTDPIWDKFGGLSTEEFQERANLTSSTTNDLDNTTNTTIDQQLPEQPPPQVENNNDQEHGDELDRLNLDPNPPPPGLNRSRQFYNEIVAHGQLTPFEQRFVQQIYRLVEQPITLDIHLE